MAQQVTKLRLAGDGGREVIPFEGGVVAYGPTDAGCYWRLRWLEFGRRRDTTARTRDEALAKAVELSERLCTGTPTSHLRARGEALVEHYLDRRRRPTRGTGWSQRHRRASGVLPPVRPSRDRRRPGAGSAAPALPAHRGCRPDTVGGRPCPYVPLGAGRRWARGRTAAGSPRRSARCALDLASGRRRRRVRAGCACRRGGDSDRAGRPRPRARRGRAHAPVVA